MIKVTKQQGEFVKYVEIRNDRYDPPVRMVLESEEELSQLLKDLESIKGFLPTAAALKEQLEDYLSSLTQSDTGC